MSDPDRTRTERNVTLFEDQVREIDRKLVEVDGSNRSEVIRHAIDTYIEDGMLDEEAWRNDE